MKRQRSTGLNFKLTEENIANDALTDSTVFRFLPLAIYASDTSGLITNYNNKAVDLWGRAPKAGETVEALWNGFEFEFSSENLLPRIDIPRAHLLQNDSKSTHFQCFIEKEQGLRLLVKGSVTPMTDEKGKRIGQISCFYEITRQQSIKEETDPKVIQLQHAVNIRSEQLKKSEERYHKMIEEVEDYAIVLLDENGIVQNWNKGAEKIKGYKEEEIVGKSFSLFYRDEDRQRKLPESLLEEARNKGKALHEGWRVRKDGSKFWGSIVITALHDSENKVVGFSKVTRDLTERKAAEDKTREVTIQLEFQNKELQEFAYAASHDMKEPLRKISFYNNFVLDAAADKLDDKSTEYLARSVEAVKRMGTLIDDLLAYSQTGSANDSFTKTDLNEILEEIVLSHKDLLEQEVANFEIGSLPVIDAIKFQVRQLMDNLINNSIKYKHPDRNLLIKITCELVNGKEIQQKEADPAAEYYRISVIDNGLGFDSAYAEKIFEIFQRLTNESGYKGSGIGLAICKKIVLNHHGIIKASGKQNEGARFDVYLPVK